MKDEDLIIVAKVIPTYVRIMKGENGIVILNTKTGESSDFIAENKDEKRILDECWKWIHNPRILRNNAKWKIMREYLYLIIYKWNMLDVETRTRANPELYNKINDCLMYISSRAHALSGIDVRSGDPWEIKRRIARFYDKTVKTYDFHYEEEQIRKYNIVLEELNIPNDSHILDIGCGTGLFIEKISKEGLTPVGVDISKNMIKSTKNKLNNQIILCADVDYLPFKDKIFDNIFTFTLLQNIPNPKNTISEICRIAKKDSTVVLSVIKVSYTDSAFLRLIIKSCLTLVKFIDKEDVKDYVAICRVS